MSDCEHRGRIEMSGGRKTRHQRHRTWWIECYHCTEWLRIGDSSPACEMEYRLALTLNVIAHLWPAGSVRDRIVRYAVASAAERCTPSVAL